MVISEKQTWVKFDLGTKPKPILTKVSQPENLKFMLKGLTAKNNIVLNALFKLISELPNLGAYQNLVD
jgi:hypothetical protein